MGLAAVAVIMFTSLSLVIANLRSRRTKLPQTKASRPNL
jgi:hypothetical protein